MNSNYCTGCDHPDHGCTCWRGGWKGTAITADGVTVTGSDIVYWVYFPDKEFHPVSRITAARRGTPAPREPMSEMYSSHQKALEAHYYPKPIPKKYRMNQPQAKFGGDWCHYCGKRSDTRFVQIDVPKNAEHSTQDGDRGFFRFCEPCVQRFQQAINKITIPINIPS